MNFPAKLFLVCASISTYFTAVEASELHISTSLDIGHKNRTQLFEEAKSKVLIKSIDKLPSIVWGTEHLNQEQYRADIHAIGFAQADVIVLSETYSPETNSYTLSAKVIFDESKIMNTLSKVKEGQNAIRSLSDIKSILKAIKIENVDNDNLMQKQTEAQILVSDPMMDNNPNRDIMEYEILLPKMQELYKKNLHSYIKKIKITYTGVKEGRLAYSVEVPPKNQLNLTFTSERLNSFYANNKVSIANDIGLCAVHLTPGKLRTTKNPNTGSKFWLSAEHPSSYIFEADPTDELIDNVVQPLIFHTCKKNAQ